MTDLGDLRSLLPGHEAAGSTSEAAGPDWPLAEQELGFELPSAYKALVDVLGPVLVADQPAAWLGSGPGLRATTLLENHRRIASALQPSFAAHRDGRRHALFPDRGGLLFVGRDPDGRGIGFLMRGDDPERWPVVVVDEGDCVDFAGSIIELWSTLTRERMFLGDDEHGALARWRASLRPVRVPFRGRVVELAALRALAVRAFGGHPTAVAISGEAGIGKTRLIGHFLTEHVAGEAAVLVGCCRQTDQRPYGPWIDMLRAGGPPGWSGPDTSRDAEQLHRSIGDALVDGAAGRPLVVLLEDLHWSDAGTVAVLHHLVRRWSSVPALLVVTTRQPEAGDLVRLGASLQRLPLRGLTPEAVAGLVADRTGEAPPPGLVRWVLRQSGGSPLLCEELLATVDRRGPGDVASLAAGDGLVRPVPARIRRLLLGRAERLGERARRVLEAAAVLGDPFDPELAATIAGVSPGGLHTDLAETLDQRMVEPAAGAPGRYAFSHALARAALLDGLEPHEAARLHAAVADHLAGDPGADPGAVAGHLQAVGTTSALAAAARWRLAAARAAQRALAFEDAARQCRLGLGLLDSLAAGDDPAGPPGSGSAGSTGSPGSGDAPLRCDLLLALARACTDLWHVEDAGAAATAAAHVAVGCDDVDRLADAARLLPLPASEIVPTEQHAELVRLARSRLGAAPTEAHAELDAWLALDALPRGTEEARRGVERAWTVACELDSPAAQVRVGYIRWYVNFGLAGRPALRDIERAAEAAADRHVERFGHPHTDDAQVRWWSAVGALLDGDRAGFSFAVEDLQRRAHRSGHPRLTMRARFGAATLALLDGDFEAVRRHVVEGERLVRWDPVTATALRTTFEGAVDAFLGRWSDLQDRIAPYAALPGLGGLRAVTATAQARAGEVDQARRTLDELLDEGLGRLVTHAAVGTGPVILGWLVELTCVTANPRPIPGLLRLLDPHRGAVLCGSYGWHPLQVTDDYVGRLLLLDDRPVAAVAALRRAVALEEGLGARAHLARSQHHLATALTHLAGHAEQARELAAAATSSARSLGLVL
jgi:AAA ATPase-like protein